MKVASFHFLFFKNKTNIKKFLGYNFKLFSIGEFI